MNENEIHFQDKFTGLIIYTKEATYSSNKHFGSFIYWELVELVSSSIIILLIIVIWEEFFRQVFI